jgi:hypothetical protein
MHGAPTGAGEAGLAPTEERAGLSPAPTGENGGTPAAQPDCETPGNTVRVNLAPPYRYSAGIEFGRAYRHAPAVTLREMRELPFVSCPLPDCHLRVTLSATPAVVEQACRECGHAGRVGAALRDWSRQYDHLQDAHARWAEGTELALLHALGSKLVELLCPVYPGPAKLLVDGYGHCLVWEWTP